MKIIRIPEYSIADLIGPGGKIIREITDKTSSKSFPYICMRSRPHNTIELNNH